MENSVEDIRKAVLDLNKELLEGFKIIDSNFEAIGKKLDAIEVKVNHLSDSSEKEFNSVDGKLSELKNEVIKIQKISGYTEQYENLLKIAR